MEKRYFYHGTSYECFLEILKSGFLSPEPPAQVWEEYSGEYVYFFDSRSNEAEYDNYAVDAAVEQAAFAISRFSHTRRVVLEVAGLDESLLEKDPDCCTAVRLADKVSVGLVTSVYLEKRNASRKLRELIAITDLFAAARKKKKLAALFDPHICPWERRSLIEESGIEGLKLVNRENWRKSGGLENRYYDLMDWHREEELFARKPLNFFNKKTATA